MVDGKATDWLQKRVHFAWSLVLVGLANIWTFFTKYYCERVCDAKTLFFEGQNGLFDRSKRINVERILNNLSTLFSTVVYSHTFDKQPVLQVTLLHQPFNL